MSKANPATIRQWTVGQLDQDVRRSLRQLARMPDVRQIAVLPDVHLAHNVCVGTAFATKQLLYPHAIGGDIGCGIAAARINASCEDALDAGLSSLHRVLSDAAPIFRRRPDDENGDGELLPVPDQLSDEQLRADARRTGFAQLGTLGSGNHFLELQHDTHGELWLMVHSGSRGIGQAILNHHVATLDNDDSTAMPGLTWDSARGQAYQADMTWARGYAAANRVSMLAAVDHGLRERFGWRVDFESLVDCDHNHISHEEIGGELLFVHRKGAAGAHKGAAGLIPGSMASPSFHVVGRGHGPSLHSSSHGAGRVMSRSHARRAMTRQRMQRELRDVYVDPRSLMGLREEAPSAYKDIETVMRVQRNLVSVTRRLHPMVTHKGFSQTRRR